jgi:hypothetical protein
MRSKTIYAAMLLFLASGVLAQPHQENLILLTDRGHYISGETIHYRAFYQGPADSEEVEWSKVLYVELIMPNGTALVQGKVPIDTGGINGSILIPEGISSGTHYLKAYTRWMRNCGQENYAYTSVRIYDSFNESVLPVDSTGWAGVGPETLLNQANPHSDALLKCSLNRTNFQTRMEVRAELLWTFPNARADLTISVARAGLHGNQEYFRPGCPFNAENDNDFLPEGFLLQERQSVLKTELLHPMPPSTCPCWERTGSSSVITPIRQAGSSFLSRIIQGSGTFLFPPTMRNTETWNCSSTVTSAVMFLSSPLTLLK